MEKLKKVAFGITEEAHRKIKIHCATKRLKIKDYLRSAIERTVNKGEKNDVPRTIH